MKNKIICGDALSELKKLPDECVDMIITSPPYYGLRDYGIKGQLGLEKTFEEYLNKILDITAELKRVLKKEGTLWWNHGDSYGGNQGRGEGKGNEHGQMIPQTIPTNTRNKAAGGVPKQDNTKCLLMQPYRLAIEMTTMIAKRVMQKKDRVWLAAMIDGEGCIHIHRRANGRKNPTYGVFLSIHNSDKRIIDKVVKITGLGGNIQTTTKDRRKKLYRWNALSNNARDILGDVYPDLVIKQEQARCALFCPSSGKDAEEAWQNVKHLNQGEPTTRDYPEPKKELDDRSPFILRNQIIWFKPNCMPSSVKDRFTVDYEPILFFSKSKKYYFERQFETFDSNKYDRARMAKARQEYGGKWAQDSGGDIKTQRAFVAGHQEGRNKRSVWTIPTQPFPEAHFAVYPEDLVATPIKAGCPKEVCKKCGKAREAILETKFIKRPTNDRPENYRAIQEERKGNRRIGMVARKGVGWNENRIKGYTKCKCSAGFQPGIVLDPFMGAGTTALVAKKLGRDYLGIELSEEYIKIAKQRLRQQVLI